MNLTTQFLYDNANIALYTPTIMQAIIALIVAGILLIALRFLFLYHHGFFLVWKEKRAIESKKSVLSDLILMKDIQSEMEKEIEQASLKATFQS